MRLLIIQQLDLDLYCLFGFSFLNIHTKMADLRFYGPFNSVSVIKSRSKLMAKLKKTQPDKMTSEVFLCEIIWNSSGIVPEQVSQNSSSTIPD